MSENQGLSLFTPNSPLYVVERHYASAFNLLWRMCSCLSMPRTLISRAVAPKYSRSKSFDNPDDRTPSAFHD